MTGLEKLKNMDYHFKMITLRETEYGNLKTTDLLNTKSFDKEFKKLVKQEDLKMEDILFIGYDKEIKTVLAYLEEEYKETFYKKYEKELNEYNAFQRDFFLTINKQKLENMREMTKIKELSEEQKTTFEELEKQIKEVENGEHKLDLTDFKKEFKVSFPSVTLTTSTPGSVPYPEWLEKVTLKTIVIIEPHEGKVWNFVEDMAINRLGKENENIR